MKSAQEMYQYCLDHNYGEGLSKKWGIKHFSLIEQALGVDEEVKMCFIGLHNNGNNFAYAITDKRLLIAEQKMIGQVFQTIDLDNLNDVTVNTGMVFGVITVDTIKEKFTVTVNKKVAQSINSAIHDVLFAVKQQKKTPMASQPSISAADELLKFKNLLDMGVITQEEFDRKKKELL